jgi:hypothetical protein
MPFHPTSWMSILILSFYLRLGLPSGLHAVRNTSVMWSPWTQLLTKILRPLEGKSRQLIVCDQFHDPAVLSPRIPPGNKWRTDCVGQTAWRAQFEEQINLLPLPWSEPRHLWRPCTNIQGRKRIRIETREEVASSHGCGSQPYSLFSRFTGMLKQQWNAWGSD